jgi:nondiscriminating glutamyl-tRNA synthetase
LTKVSSWALHPAHFSKGVYTNSGSVRRCGFPRSWGRAFLPAIFSFTMQTMLDQPVKTRFAPSPTGYLHLGNARTALFNYLLARKYNGTFILRIEDTDQARSKAEYEQALKEDLRWLDFGWTEGPEAASPRGPYVQSQRRDIYQRHYDVLVRNGLAYDCFCSEQELKQARRAQLAAGQPPRYPGTCAGLSAADVQRKRAQGLQSSLRFRVPRDAQVAFEDLVRGPQRMQTEEIGDFVIRRSDGGPAFFFSNAVDDSLMGVTHVLRGEDHLSNTPRQLLVLQALGCAAPAYGHIALLMSGDGSPLSKRRGAKSLRELRIDGYLPQAVNNYLARLGHVYEQHGLLSQEALVEGFELARLGRAPARFDPDQLRYWQKEAVTHAADEELWAWMANRTYMDSGRIEELVPAEARLEFVRAVRDNIDLPVEAFVLAGDIFRNFLELSSEARERVRAAGAKFFEVALSELPPTATDFQSYAQAVGRATGAKGKKLFMPLRAALTGETHGPEMARVFPLIGSERARARLQAALRIASEQT